MEWSLTMYQKAVPLGRCPIVEVRSEKPRINLEPERKSGITLAERDGEHHRKMHGIPRRHHIQWQYSKRFAKFSPYQSLEFSMKRLFLYPLLAAICFNAGNIPAPAQSYGERYRPPLFFDHHNPQLDAHALELIKKHVQHLEETKVPDSELLPVMSALALLLRDTPDRKQSIELFKKCLAIREKLGDHSSEEYKMEVAGYAEAAFNNDDPQTAEDLISKLIPLAPEYDLKHKLKFALVECYTDEKNYARAEHLLLDTIKQNEAVGQCFSNELLGVAEWYAAQKRFDEAKPWYLKAIAKAKAEGNPTAGKRMETAMSRFFVKDNKPADVTTLLKKSSPQIMLSESDVQLDLGAEGGVHYGMSFIPAARKDADGKVTPFEEEWMKQYRLALKKLNQKNYQHAEALFKDGSQKFKGTAEALVFDIGLAKIYMESKNQPKLREVLTTLVKTQGNGIGPPQFKSVNTPGAAGPGKAKAKETAKESKPIKG
jgi:tetratricopeptide (TPR) repeat protein